MGCQHTGVETETDDVEQTSCIRKQRDGRDQQLSSHLILLEHLAQDHNLPTYVLGPTLPSMLSQTDLAVANQCYISDWGGKKLHVC